MLDNGQRLLNLLKDIRRKIRKAGCAMSIETVLDQLLGRVTQIQFLIKDKNY